MTTGPITLDERADSIVTVSAYALGKTLGVSAAMQELERQIAHPDRGSLPAARCIARLRELADLAVRADTGGTVLGQVRSRHAHDAWTLGARLGARTWVSVDDDVEATTATLRDLLDAVRGQTPRIVVAPCLLRVGDGRLVANVEFPHIVTSSRMLPSGARLRSIKSAGFALVAMNREALAAVRDACEHLAYLDQDGVTRLGLFHSAIHEGRWLSEDLAFFARVPPEVECEALITGHTSHDGQALDLESLA